MDTRLNKSDYILLLIFYAISTLLNGIDYYREGNKLIEYLVDLPATIITSFCVIILFMYWIIPSYLIRKTNYFLLVFFILIVLFIFGMLDYTLGFWSGGNNWSKFPKWYNLILNSIFISANDTGLIFGLLLTKKFYESQTQLVTIEKQQKENELKLLRSQIDPHFLFNNLNTLDALIDSDTEKAKEYINRLSLTYRYLIKTKDAEIMELSEEITLAENYMFLIRTRFGEDYDFKVDKQTPIKDKFIPTGAIQTLLENVVKHNKPQSNKTIKTVITIEENTVRVVNTKTNIKSKNESFGTGLENLKARYKLLSDKKVVVVDTEAAFSISIPIIKLIH